MDYAFFKKSEIFELGNFKIPETLKTYCIGKCKVYSYSTVMSYSEKKLKGGKLADFKKIIKSRNECYHQESKQTKILSAKKLAVRLSISVPHVRLHFSDLAQPCGGYFWIDVTSKLDSVFKEDNIEKTKVINAAAEITLSREKFPNSDQELLSLLAKQIDGAFTTFSALSNPAKPSGLRVVRSICRTQTQKESSPKIITKLDNGMWDYTSIGNSIQDLGLVGKKYAQIINEFKRYGHVLNNAVVARSLKVIKNPDISRKDLNAKIGHNTETISDTI